MTLRPDGRNRGFTLIEMLVVLAVLGLSVGLIAGRGPWRSPALDSRAAAGQLAQGLRLARAQAIARNRQVVLLVDTTRGSFRVGDGPPQLLPRGLALAVTTVAGQELPGSIAFLPDGSSTGGRIGLAAGAARTWVGVDWLTGRVSIVNVP